MPRHIGTCFRFYTQMIDIQAFVLDLIRKCGQKKSKKQSICIQNLQSLHTTAYRLIHRNSPKRRTPSQNGGSASRIHQHTAQKRGSASRIHQPKGGSASRFHQPDGGPPLDFINIQPSKRGSASKIHHHQPKNVGYASKVNLL